MRYGQLVATVDASHHGQAGGHGFNDHAAIGFAKAAQAVKKQIERA